MNLPTVQPLLHCYLLCHKSLWPSAGNANWSFGGLYAECTTTPDMTIVILSTVPCTLINVLNLQFVLLRSFHMIVAIGDENSTTIHVVWTNDIPAILGLERYMNMCVSWRHRQ